VSLARQLELDTLPEMSERLSRIERAIGPG
jgi:hypothetical protein